MSENTKTLSISERITQIEETFKKYTEQQQLIAQELVRLEWAYKVLKELEVESVKDTKPVKETKSKSKK